MALDAPFSGLSSGLSFGLSSGDLLADRRADYAEMLAADGDWQGATELLSTTLDLVPRWAAGWFRLGELHEKGGNAQAAETAWRQVLALEPDDRFGASLKLALLGATPVPDTPPTDFVEALFDTYAERFETSLVQKLGYCVPDSLGAALRAAHPDPFFHALDLGCGTGLMGARLHPYCAYLEGIDLSAAMLRKARKRGIYDRLRKGDIAATQFPMGIDLVTAADVLIYVGTLDTVFAKVAAALQPGGLFGFSIELSHTEDVLLRESRRYAHSRAYMERELRAAGLRLACVSPETIRTDRGQPVQGLVVVAER